MSLNEGSLPSDSTKAKEPNKLGSNGFDRTKKFLKRACKCINGTPNNTIAATFTPMSDVAQPSVALAA